MLAFKYSEFAHLIQTDFWYMVGSTGAIAVASCGFFIVLFELIKPFFRKKRQC